MQDELQNIRNLVGPIDADQLRYVDCFIGNDIGLFMPVGGACFYALVPLHSHPSYMFVLPFDDQTVVKIDEKTITARPGMIFVLSPYIPHHELPTNSPPRYIAIFIDKGFFENQLSQYPVGQDVIFSGKFHKIAPTLLPLLKKFMIEADNKIPGFENVLHALSLEICHSIIRGMFNFESARDRVSSRIEIDRAVEYLHSNLDKKMTVEDMAQIAHMSHSHFCRIFKNEIGVSPGNYLSRIRMERAKKLLLADDKSITEVALECGLGSSAYLSSCFYKRYKITPSDYRKGIKKGHISKKHSRILKD